ncbi:hypothetical protein Ahy_B10g100778 [Arachis hypogaea]|uniref:Uncharacterized protein n=1 Tax=Arachis hypogaea TaxID=3818 RepID=A0A444WXM9_ARAHY|nr:hypothetical protein Ahy_B10g100778 [Arachis hypogaea]
MTRWSLSDTDGSVESLLAAIGETIFISKPFDPVKVIVQQVDVASRSEGAIGSENIAVTTVQTENIGRNIRPRGNLPPPPLTSGWPPYGLLPGYTPPVGSTSNAANSMAVYRQQVEESHHDLKFERLARQVERIARIVDYEEGERHNARGNNEGFKNIFQNEKDVVNRENPHVVPRAHLAEKVRQNELMKKEKEKHRSEQRSKSKPFTRKEKVVYVTIESSEDEINFETEVDLAELKKGPPYIFDVLLKDKQLILPEGRTLLSVKDLKEKPYCKFHQAKSHLTNSCVHFRDLIQGAIMEGRLKFDDGKKEIKVDVDPFEADASFVEPCFGVNMVGMSYDFDVALDDFQSQVRSVYPRAGDGLLDFLVQQKIKDRDVSLCPRCNVVFDVEVAAIFEKERMKKELAHREEQARQRQPIRCIEGQSSKTLQHSIVAPLSRSQAIGVQWIRNCQEFQKARGYPRGRGGRRNFNQNKKPQVEVSKGAMPSVHSRIVFPSDGETCLKGIPSPTNMEKGKAVAQSSGVDKNKEVDIDEEYFDEGDDDIIGTISIIPTEYLGEYEGDPDEYYDMEDEEVFSFIRIEDEPGYFLRPTEKQMSHLCPLHITTILSGIKINKVLINGGAAISLLPERMLVKVGNHPDDLVPTNIAMTDFRCYLSSEGLSMKLRYPELGFASTSWDCLS